MLSASAFFLDDNLMTKASDSVGFAAQKGLLLVTGIMVAPSGVQMTNLQQTFAVPEPGSLVLLALAGLPWAMYRLFHRVGKRCQWAKGVRDEWHFLSRNLFG